MAYNLFLNPLTQTENNNMINLLNSVIPPPFHLKNDFGWDHDDCSPNIVIQGDDEFIFRKDFDESSTDCVRGKVGFTNGIHAWKIYWNPASRDPYSIIGVATRDTSLHADEISVLVGGDNCSWGWDVQSTMLYHNSHPGQGTMYPKFVDEGIQLVVPNEVAMLLNMNEGTLSYFVKGCYLGVAFEGLAGLKLYPMINVTSKHTQVRLEYLGNTSMESKSISFVDCDILCKLRTVLSFSTILSQVNMVILAFFICN